MRSTNDVDPGPDREPGPRPDLAKVRRAAVVTGASSGIGFATALHLATRGWRVYAGMRNLAKAPALESAAAGLSLSVVELDVTDDVSVQRAFDEIHAEAELEALVNNAGVSGAGPLEVTPDDEHRLMFETNYFGAVRCIKASLPGMRARGRGVIVNVTSLSGVFPWPNQSCYAASKWALEGLSASLAHEVRGFGIRVVSVQPGAVRTEIIENSKERTHFDRASPYLPVMKRNGRLISAGFRHGTTPQDVAEVILHAMTSADYRLRWPAGRDAEAIASGAATASLDEFVELGAASDEDHRAWFEEHFGMEL